MQQKLLKYDTQYDGTIWKEIIHTFYSSELTLPFAKDKSSKLRKNAVCDEPGIRFLNESHRLNTFWSNR